MFFFKTYWDGSNLQTIEKMFYTYFKKTCDVLISFSIISHIMRTAVDSSNFVQNWTSNGLYRNQKYEVCEVQCIFVSEILLLKIFGKSVCKSMFAINFLTRGIILTIEPQIPILFMSYINLRKLSID